MDVKSFLESGLLEAYVLGQCSPAERELVEGMLEAHPELRAELAAVEQALERVAQAYAVPPPAGAKERLLERLRAETDARATGTDGQSNLWSSRQLWWWAAITLLTGLLLWQLQEKRQMAERLEAQQEEVARCQEREQQQARLQEVVALLRDRDTRAVVLSDAADGEGGTKVTATVWHNPMRGETVLDINSLPAPPEGRYFQFWAIVNGAPVSMGMVEWRGEDAFQKLPFVRDAQAFAISAEDNPNGNPTPTQVVLVGKI